MDHEEVRLKLVDPDFRLYFNWVAFERVAGMKKYHLNNILFQRKYCVFKDEEVERLNQYFSFLAKHFKKENLKEILLEPTVRGILNWTGIEKGLGLNRWTLKIVLLQFPEYNFKEEDYLKLRTLMDQLAIHFSKK